MRAGIEYVLALGSLLAASLAGTASAQIPDVITYDVGVNGGDTNDIAYYGQASGIAAYSIATQSCNAGTDELLWIDGGGSNQHPVIAQNMFRYKDGRFEQIGYSWLKHGFCAVSEIEADCAPCLPDAGCDELGIGCADTYWATLNDGGSGRSKRYVNATTGVHTDGTPGPTGLATIRGRLQVAVADIDPAQNPGAQWFIEGQYVAADDAQAGVGGNNASWRRVSVSSVSNINGGGPTHREEPAIFAWKDQDPGVGITSFLNSETGGKSIFFLGYRVTPAGPGIWHYEYAVQNLNSDQSAGSFTVPANPAVSVTNIGFHDVNPHSGDPYDPTDWSGARVVGGDVRWASPQTYAENPDSNALRWGTLYNFRFDASAPPVTGSVTLGLFKPGPNSEVTVDNVLVPESLPFDKYKPATSAPNPGGSVTTPFTASRGSRYNPDVLLESAPAVVGQEWRGAITLPGLVRGVLLTGSAQEGVLTRAGELLIGAPVQSRLLAGDPVIRIPDDPALAGTQFSAQVLAFTGDGWALTNALDITIGLPAR